MTEAKNCDDKNCPVHGQLKTRGRTLAGFISSAKMGKTAVFEREWKHLIPKYRRYEKKRTVLKVHNPDCMAAKAGDKVKIAECRPLSKTKKFVIVEKIMEKKNDTA